MAGHASLTIEVKDTHGHASLNCDSPDVEKAHFAHNRGQCTHTARYRPWTVDVVVKFADEARAVAFEKYLKSGSGCEFARVISDRTSAIRTHRNRGYSGLATEVTVIASP
jgi:hypothetical protein